MSWPGTAAAAALLQLPARVLPSTFATHLTLQRAACVRWSSTTAQIPHLQLLQHEHLVGNGPGGTVSYDLAHETQEGYRRALLEHKAQSASRRTQDSTARATSDSQLQTESESEPRPRLLSFEATPTFTLGRRQTQPTHDQQARMDAPLHVNLTKTGRRVPLEATMQPEIRHTNRGGLTTYHGPGQLVLWPILDMHSPLYPKFEVASYAGHLEATTQRLLEDVFGIETTTLRDEPGVWVVDPVPADSNATVPPVQRKIAALGVHHRRHVTGLGIAINVDIATSGVEPFNPWARFVPCGLEGKEVTSIAAELGPHWQARLGGSGVWDMEDLARRWAVIFEAGLEDGSLRGTTSRT